MINHIVILDANDVRAEMYFRLTDAQLRSKREPEKGVLIAEAETVIETALDEGLFPLSVLCVKDHTSPRAEQVISACARCNPDLDVLLADIEVFREMTGFELTRGILAAMRRPESRDAQTVCAGARCIAVLEGISDAGNIGAIFRCAAGLGVDALLLTRSCCDPLVRRSIRVSMGTALKMPWAYLDGEDAGQEMLHSLGFRTVALALSENAIPIDDGRIARLEKRALYLGCEGTGLRKETIDACDYTAIIPMMRGVDSLNVAAAAAVAFWQLRPREQ